MLARLSEAAVRLLCLSLLLPTQLIPAIAQSKRTSSPRKVPGKTATGMLLPNGWKLTPEGAQIPVSDLPLNMVLSNDGRFLLVTTNGNGDQTINVIDLQTGQSQQTVTVKKSWLGLAFAPDGKRFFVSGGDDNEVMIFDFDNGKAEESGKIILGSADYHKLNDTERAEARRKGLGEFAFPAGIAVTPDGKRLYVAENLSHSKYWATTAIFSLEDDAQNGPDHVDAHRSIAFVASPYTRRGFVDSTMYTTSGMLRTMELILGIPPMSQYDAAATPMFNSFTNKADLTPFKHRPAKYDLTEKNPVNAPGAQQSASWDFSKEDTLPDIEFNEVIWMSVHGANSRMPAPVRSAFVRPIEDEDDDEGDRDRERKERNERSRKVRRR